LLAFWLRRGDALPAAAAGRETALRELFQFAGTALPVAALTRQADCKDAAGALWLRADPAHVRADMATARLLACGELGLTPADCDELLRPLKPLFGDSGFPIDAPVPSRWYLRAPAGAQLPTFQPPEQVLGDDLRRHLPEGNEGRRWRSLLNEAQIVLHNHPLNAQRIARGQLPVNSLWFWGAGSLPQWVRTPLARVLTRDGVLAALAAQTSCAVLAPQPGAPAGFAGETLLDLDDPAALPTVARDWLPAVEQALAQGRIDALALRFVDGARAHYRPANRWRFWRRVRPLQG
ncbi:phosphoglycerate mutase, partial [Tahibacter caeni]|uniref:phosphoglycerate mutase n=1 Tax=Tahibacter caeni TaxID=1453545 RepID=UPI002148E1AB